MALVLADRVQETSTTTGTGTLTLAGAVSGYQTFSAGIGNGNTCYYTIQSDTGAWEVGVGTVGAGTLARTTLISSSTGSAVSFSGTLTVFVTYPAEKAIYQDAAGNTYVPSLGATTPSTGAFTTASASTSVTTPIVQATNSGGLALKNSAGTTQISMGAGGGDNCSVNVSTNLNGTNAQIDISPTGTGHVHINPSGSGAVEINPTSVGTINNMTIGSTTVAAGSFSTLNSSGATRLGGLSGNQSLQVNNVASGVNYARVVGGITTVGPQYTAQGTDTNIDLLFTTKGTGSYYFGTGGGTQLAISNTASAVNFFQTRGAATGGAPDMSAQGTDTNVNISYSAKNAGYHFFYVNSAAHFSISPTASVVNRIDATGGAAGVGPTLSAQGSDANINIKMTPKGTGTVQFGTYTAGVVAQAGFITITDAGGTSRRLLVG